MIRVAALGAVAWLIVVGLLAGCAATPAISTPPDDLLHARAGTGGS